MAIEAWVYEEFAECVARRHNVDFCAEEVRDYISEEDMDEFRKMVEKTRECLRRCDCSEDGVEALDEADEEWCRNNCECWY